MIQSIKKRDGKIVPFEEEKVINAVEKAFMATAELDTAKVPDVSRAVAVFAISSLDDNNKLTTVEEIQDAVESAGGSSTRNPSPGQSPCARGHPGTWDYAG